MALTTKERKIIRESLTNGGGVHKAVRAWAKCRGFNYAANNSGGHSFYVLDVEKAVAENAARRKRNKEPNVHYQSDESLRKSLASGSGVLDWEYKTGDYDSSTALDYATICHLFLKGKTVAQIEQFSHGGNIGEHTASEIRSMIRPLRELVEA